MLSDLFPPELKTRSFFVYSILSQLGDTMKELTLIIIKYAGWKNTFKISGGFGMVVGIIGLIFV
jgi:hypothetical protein